MTSTDVVIDGVVVDAMLSDIFLALLGEADVYANPVSDADLSLSASVSMTGEWPGHVVVGCSDGFARRFASRLFLTDIVSDSDIVDAIGELANVVGGNVKSVVPGPNVLSLPHVVRGSEYWPNAAEAVRLDLCWEGEPLRVSVWSAASVKE
ncbi:MAG: chemotaxis protein CheX [Jatrophihabitans sp.]|uniref:chemotaxis protein CheX n=1 Tax=Jatrophihabitans sp. TaxID=1932789 RepID=UPI003F7D363B